MKAALDAIFPLPDVLVLFYHAVSDAPLPHIGPLYACKSAAQFEHDLEYLKANFNLVGHDDIVAAREGLRRLPERAAALTFDDGFAQCFTVARPLLLKHRVPCTFFVIQASVDNRQLMHRNKLALCLSRLAGARRRWARTLRFRDRAAIDALCMELGVDAGAYLREVSPYMTTAQIRELHADGFIIGAHTVEHPELEHLPWPSARAEIERSCDYVRALTGRERVPFAFPFNGIRLPRGPLARLRDEAGTVDLMYDTNNLMHDCGFVVNRIWCDSPPKTARSNLPLLLGRARAYEPLRRVKRSLSSLPH